MLLPRRSFPAAQSIVLKAVSGKALHKSKSGLVAAGLANEAEIGRAFRAYRENAAQYKPYKSLRRRWSRAG